MKDENKEETDTTKRIDDSAKILITKVVEKKLIAAVDRICLGFEAGRISRLVVASWLLEKGCDDLSEIDIKEIRAQSFNVVNALSALVRRIQETGKVPAELKQLLLVEAGLDAPAKRSSKSRLTKEYINDVVDAESEVSSAA